MCGITGIVNYGPGATPITTSLLTTMSDQMIHRGPDGSGEWISKTDPVGLAHRRLAIVDLTSAGQQPMPNEDGSLQSVVNGEIYNSLALREMLETRGHVFRSQTDIEVIVHLYEEFGEEFIEHLDGDFAFALWDSKKKIMFLGRDRAGVKPLYWTNTGRSILFASEIKALLEHPDVQPSLNEKGFYNYLTFLVVPAPETLFEGIFKLEAAEIIQVECSSSTPRFTHRKFFKPFPNVNPTPRNEQTVEQDIEKLVLDSVRKRKMSDVPVGVLFSSGVDSTLNAIEFGKGMGAEVKTFTVGVTGDGLKYEDDFSRARAAAKDLKLDHHEVTITAEDVSDFARDMIWFLDEPLADPVTAPLYFVTKLAKENGVTVVQAGEGADEIFCGYDKYLAAERHYNTLWKPVKRLPLFARKFAYYICQFLPFRLAPKIADILGRAIREQHFFLTSSVGFSELEKKKILSSEFLTKMKDEDSFDIVTPLHKELHENAPDASILQTIQYIELQVRLPELLLMRADKLGMANSVEIRVPFLDRDLIDYSLSIQDDDKRKDGIGKKPLKSLLFKYMTHDYVYRPKTSFGLPVHEFFNGPLGDEFLELLKRNSDVGSILNIKALEKKLKRGLSSKNEGFQIWQIYIFLIWKNVFKVNISNPDTGKTGNALNS